MDVDGMREGGGGWGGRVILPGLYRAAIIAYMDRRAGYYRGWFGGGWVNWGGEVFCKIGSVGVVARTYSSSSTPTHVGQTGLPSIA